MPLLENETQKEKTKGCMQMMWSDLTAKNKPDGKPEYQECDVIFTAQDNEAKQFGSCFFRNCAIQNPDGMTSSPASIMYFADSPTENQQAKLNEPVKCRAAMKPDTGQYSVNGHKYTFMIGEKKASGGGGWKGGGGRSADPVAITRSVALKAGVELCCADKVKFEELLDVCENLVIFLDDRPPKVDLPI